MELLKYLPPFYADLKDMVDIQSSQGIEIEMQRAAITDLLNQFFVNTATWGLDIWERELGIATSTGANERRREVIMAKLRGAGTTTKEMIRSVASAFSGGDVEVMEYPGEYRFVVKFTGVLGIPPNMDGLVTAIDEIKPAHLAYSFTYKYTTWSMLQGLTWQQVGGKTWGELRTYGGG